MEMKWQLGVFGINTGGKGSSSGVVWCKVETVVGVILVLVLEDVSADNMDNKEFNEGLVEAWYSLEQYIGLKEDKLSSTTVDFIRSEGNLETKCLYWFSKPKMC